MAMALLRDNAAAGAEMSELRSALRRYYGIPYSSADAPTRRATARERMGATDIGGEDGKISQLAMKPGQETL